MHEASLAKNLLQQVCAIQRGHPLTRIAEVEIECGPMSGVEPLLLSAAFGRLVTDDGLEEIELIIQEVALKAICQVCQQQNVIHDYQFICSHCQSNKLDITQGDCVRLMSVNLIPIESCEASVPCSQRTSE
jgi:hydrogenase nickel incorporation protein HypA/HybF